MSVTCSHFPACLTYSSCKMNRAVTPNVPLGPSRSLQPALPPHTTHFSEQLTLIEDVYTLHTVEIFRKRTGYKKQDRQYTYNVALGRVRVTTVVLCSDELHVTVIYI